MFNPDPNFYNRCCSVVLCLIFIIMGIHCLHTKETDKFSAIAAIIVGLLPLCLYVMGVPC